MDGLVSVGFMELLYIITLILALLILILLFFLWK